MATARDFSRSLVGSILPGDTAFRAKIVHEA